MNKLRTAAVFAPYIVVAIVHLVGLANGDTALSGFTKPLLMPLLLVALLFLLPRWRSEVALLATLALLFSFAGDVGLNSAGEFAFLVALGCFLLAHVSYIVLFLRKLRMRRLSFWALAYLVWWVALIVILAPHIGSLLIPVAIYGLVLGAMAAIALSCNTLIAYGGVLFVVSDTLLGLHKFLPGFNPWQVDYFIMLTYIAAQALIVLGAIHWAWAKDSTTPRGANSPSAATS